MSQNQTVVPGMKTGGQVNEVPQNFYTRETAGGSGYSKGTYVPGMQQQVSQQPYTGNQNQQSANSVQGKPVVGFLYSISRQGLGEYWPLHVGSNTIGSSPKCDVCLREGTISSEHSVLVIRKMKNPERTIASLCDSRSTNGTMLNGESLAFNAVECKNNDVIIVGENYQLVLLLIDTQGLGLRAAQNFIALDNAQQETEEESSFGPDIPSSMPNDPYTNYQQFGVNNDSTIGLDGSTVSDKGGTMPM